MVPVDCTDSYPVHPQVAGRVVGYADGFKWVVTENGPVNSMESPYAHMPGSYNFDGLYTVGLGTIYDGRNPRSIRLTAVSSEKDVVKFREFHIK